MGGGGLPVVWVLGPPQVGEGNGVFSQKSFDKIHRPWKSYLKAVYTSFFYNSFSCSLIHTVNRVILIKITGRLKY